MGILLNGLCFPNISPFPVLLLVVPFPTVLLTILVLYFPHSAHIHFIIGRPFWFPILERTQSVFVVLHNKISSIFKSKKNIIKNINGRNKLSERNRET